MTEPNNLLVEVQNISKRFPGVQALKNVSLQIERGTVHALVGENGAGKSTLMKILAGLYRPEEGKIIFNGKEAVFHNASEALERGISTIYQELLLCPNLTVAENIFLGREPTQGIFLSNEMIARCQRELDRIGFTDLKPTTKVSSLTVAQKQLVEIAKALTLDSSLIIMDEPTSSLTPGEVKHLFQTIRQLKAQDKAIIFISHRIEEVFEIADHVTILRDGELVTSRPIGEVTYDDVVRMMVNRELAVSLSQRYTSNTGEVLLEGRHLTRRGAFQDISFTLHSQEVLGFAGLVGAGRTELMRAIFGIDQLDSGQVFIGGREAKIGSPQQAIRLGLGMATEDRKDDGLFSVLSVRENMTMAHLGLGPLTAMLGFVRQRKEVDMVRRFVRSMDIRTPSIATPILSLSGGNQQKVILSRWLMTEPKVLILDEPTRGIDVGAKAEIHRLIRQLAQEGRGIIVVSSELPELLAVSDHIIVMREGIMTAQLVTADTTQEEIMTYATIKPNGKEELN
jgi:ABC-type sugar transport system ATPase subunit